MVDGLDMTGIHHVASAVEPMARPDLASLPRWAGWSGAGRLRLHLATYARCLDCRVDVQQIGEWYMVHDNVWVQAGGCGRGYLCVGCLEARLGRRLTPADFPDGPLNCGDRWPLRGFEHVPIQRSARLRDRIGLATGGTVR